MLSPSLALEPPRKIDKIVDGDRHSHGINHGPVPNRHWTWEWLTIYFYHRSWDWDPESKIRMVEAVLICQSEEPFQFFSIISFGFFYLFPFLLAAFLYVFPLRYFCWSQDVLFFSAPVYHNPYPLNILLRPRPASHPSPNASGLRETYGGFQTITFQTAHRTSRTWHTTTL